MPNYIPGNVTPHVPEKYLEDEDDPDYEFPLWWFFLAVPSQSFGPWLVGSTLWGVVVPTMIGETFGDDDKAFVLATLGTLGTITGFAAPLTGSLSDRLPEFFPGCVKYFGRRRPFYLVGQIIGVTSIYYTWVALDQKRTVLLFVSWGLSNLCWQFTSPPYNTIFQEIIPESQRGYAVTINGWLCQICIMIGNGVGILYGAGHVSAAAIWWFQIIAGYIQIPLACWAMSGKACSPFWWAPERMPTEKQRAEQLARRKKEQEDAAASRMALGLVARKDGCVNTAIDELTYFVSPFKTPAFRWLWIQGFIGTIGGTIQGSLLFYWFQDCFPDGYYFFHWKLAKDVQSAVAINGMVGAIVNSAVSWSGNYWRDRVGGRQICLGFGPWALTGIIGFVCPFTYVLFSVSFLSYDAKYLFTVVLFWTVWNNFFGGFASAGGGALGIDVLPIDPNTGRASNPARDSSLQGFAGRIPNVFLPMFLGGAIKWFPSHLHAFNTFFVVGGLISIASWWILALLVHPPSERPGRQWQCTRHWCHGDTDPWYEEGGVFEGQVDPKLAARLAARNDPNSGGRAGAGAVCCDKALFGPTIYEVAARATGILKSPAEEERLGSKVASTAPRAQESIEALLPKQR